MHISEGVLGIPVLAAGAAVTLGGLFVGTRRVSHEEIPKVALMTAAFFVASLVHVPVGPSNAHLVLNGLVGLILGWAAFPAIFIGLVLQAVLFQFGGLTTLGVNTANMAVPGIVFGLAARRFMDTERPNLSALAAGAAGGLGVLGAGLLVALSLALSGDSFFVAAGLIFGAHIPVALVEAVVTGFAVRFLLRVRPQIILGSSGAASNGNGTTRAASVMALFLFAVSLFPSNVQAHRVNVFAWFDGEAIVGKAYYASGRPARGAAVMVRKEGSERKVAVETDEQGRFSIPSPEPGRYVIELSAGLGHKAETTVAVGGYHGGSGHDGKVATAKETSMREASSEALAAAAKLETKGAAFSCSELEGLMDRVLRRQLAPVRDEIEALATSQSRVTFRDVVAGIGYIVGIMGIWAYVTSKRRE